MSEAAHISSASNGVGSTIMLKNSSGVMFIKPVEGEASSKAESKQNYLAEVKTDVVSFAITPDEDAATEQQEEFSTAFTDEEFKTERMMWLVKRYYAKYRKYPYTANLSKACLDNESNLLGTSLSYLNLSEANLSKTNLCGANLESANLSKAQLTSADLRGANLRKANLEKANLKDANLDGAILNEAKLSGAIMPDGTTHE